MPAAPSVPFLKSESLYAGLTTIAMKPEGGTITGATATATTDVIAAADHSYVNGDLVLLNSLTDGAGLTAGQYYWVRDVIADTSFKVSETRGGAAVDISADGTALSFSKVIAFEAKKLSHEIDQQETAIELPDDDGVNREVRNVLTKQQESWVFESPEPKRTTKIFGGALAGRVVGTATIWIPDPDDANDTIAMKSEDDFACTITRDGNMEFGDSNFTNTTIRLKSNKQGPIIMTPDASLS